MRAANGEEVPAGGNCFHKESGVLYDFFKTFLQFEGGRQVLSRRTRTVIPVLMVFAGYMITQLLQRVLFFRSRSNELCVDRVSTVLVLISPDI